MLYYDIIKDHPADKTVFIFKGKTTTYGDFRHQVDTWANFLQAKGVKKGDKVGLFSKNSPNFVAAYIAIIKAGGVVVPFNFQLIAPEVAYIASDTDMKIMITQKKMDLEPALAELGFDNKVEQFHFEELWEETDHEFVQCEMEENENCVIIYTSGTTGRPKGAMLSHRNLISNSEDFIDVVNVQEDDIAMCVLPMYHCFGWICSVSANLLKGTTVVIQETYAFNDAMSLIKRYHVNGFCGVPTMFQLFVKGAEPEELAQMRYFISGGASLPRILFEGFQRKFGRIVQEGYGLSEATPVCTFNPASLVKMGSIGLPITHVTVSIQDEDGNEMGVGEVGELCVKGPNVMLGYLNRPQETAYTLRGGWLHTEDLAYRDEDGYIFIVDRLKDMIISSGENVYPREVEEVLMAHPDIVEAAIIGIPDKLRGQAICAYVVPAEGAKLDKRVLRKYLLARVAPYKVPKEFILAEQLPRNNTGKILKTVLRERSLNDMVNRHRL